MAAAQDANNVPTFRLDSQLVVLDLVVTDRKGNVVKGLTRDDFVVYEDGAEQNIKTFEAPEQKPALPVVAQKDRNGRDNWGDSPLTIFVIDAMNTPFGETAYCREQVDRYLKAQPALLAQPAIVLWLNDSGFHPISSFTRNRDALIAAIDRHSASVPDNYARGDLLKMFNESLAALQQIALFSRGHRGSKQIVWVGRSFPSIDGTNMTARQLEAFHRAVRSTINLLLESRTTVYVIDPTVQTGPPDQTGTDAADASLMSAAEQMPAVAGVVAGKSADPFMQSFDFKRLVTQSGGQYLQNRNDLHNEIGESIDKGTTFYSLSYVPSRMVEDDDYRKIEVRTKNTELVVHTREGYYPASLLQNAITPKELRFDLFEAMVTGMEYSGVELRLEGCKPTPDRSEALCDVLVENESLTPISSADEARAQITTVIAALDAKSQPLANRVSQSELNLPAVNAAGDAGSTRVHLHLFIPPTTKSIRIVIRDASGRMGTANVASQAIPALVCAKSANKK